MSVKVYSKLTVNGPIKIPTGPKRAIPPKTEKRIKKGGTFILLPIMYGVKKLSIVPTIMIDQTARPTAETMWSVAKRKIIAGTETIAVPTDGMREVMAATTPQMAAFCTPNKLRPMVIKIP